MIVPDTLQALGKSAEQGGVPSQTLGLVQLRASQINAWNRLNVTTRQMAGSDPGFAAPDSAVIVTAEPEPDK